MLAPNIWALSAATRWAIYAYDPIGFARDALRVELTPDQQRIVRAVVAHNRVAVRSGRKVGKSLVAAVLALWVWATRPDATVFIVSTTDDQSNRVVWREVKKLHQRSQSGPLPLPGKVNLRARRGLESPDGRATIQSLAVSTREAAAGLSGVNQFYILDEASGIPDDHAAAIFGNLLGGGGAFAISNPTRDVGWFADIWLGRSKDRWRSFTLSSLDVPDGVPGLASKAEIRKWARELGEESPEYQRHVLGLHVTNDDGASFSFDLIQQAMSRRGAIHPKDTLIVGIDPAGEGEHGRDLIAFAFRRGNAILELQTFDKLSAAQHVEKLAAALQRLRPNDREQCWVNVDKGGGIGWEVYQAIAAGRDRLHITPMGFESHHKPIRYPHACTNRGTELVWGFREFLRGGGSIPQDEKLEQECRAWQFIRERSDSEKLKVDKALVRKAIGRSPDRFDACALAAWAPQWY